MFAVRAREVCFRRVKFAAQVKFAFGKMRIYEIYNKNGRGRCKKASYG